jgi:hypothetical protein
MIMKDSLLLLFFLAGRYSTSKEIPLVVLHNFSRADWVILLSTVATTKNLVTRPPHVTINLHNAGASVEGSEGTRPRESLYSSFHKSCTSYGQLAELVYRIIKYHPTNAEMNEKFTQGRVTASASYRKEIICRSHPQRIEQPE